MAAAQPRSPMARMGPQLLCPPATSRLRYGRGSGNWLDREDSESVNAFGRTYNYNLNRNLETVDFQSGIDLGKRGSCQTTTSW